ncbi:MAG: trigger factor [Spirochaetia bacterium]|nr:trigger factor [Spirochaetia bacterium]
MAKINLDKITDTRFRAKIILDPEEKESARKKAIDKIRKTKKISGFRAGKIPDNIIQTRFSGEIKEETLNLSVQENIEEIAQKSPKGIFQIVGVENLSEEKNTYKYDLLFDCAPYIQKIKLKNVTLVENFPDVSESDIMEELKEIQRGGAHAVSKDEEVVTAQKGDLITIDYELWVNDTPHGDKQKGVKFILGEEKFDKKFEEELIQKQSKINDEISVKIDAPERPQNEEGGESRAKTYEIHALVNNIEKVVYPEINDEMAKAYSNKFQSLDDLKLGLKNDMQKRFNRKNKTIQLEMAFVELKKNVEVCFPEGFIDKKVKDFFAEYKMDVSKVSEEHKKEMKEAVIERFKGTLINEYILTEAVKDKSKEEINNEFLGFINAEFDKQVSSYIEEILKTGKKDKFFDRISTMFNENLIFEYFRKNKWVKKGKTLPYKEIINVDVHKH